MYFKIQLVSIVVSILITASIFQLIRKRKLLERYSLLWFGSAIILLLFSIWRDLLEKLALMLGVEYAPSVLLVVIIFCGFVLSLHFSVVISKLTEQNKILAQELAILKYDIKKQQNSSNTKMFDSPDEIKVKG